MVGHTVGQGNTLARDLSIHAQAGLGGVVAGGHAQHGAVGIAQLSGGSGLGGSLGSGSGGSGGSLGGGGSLILVNIDLLAASCHHGRHHGDNKQKGYDFAGVFH